MQFDGPRYVRLLKRKQRLIDEGKSETKEFEKLNNQMINYNVILRDYLFWLSKSDYELLIKSFINGSISRTEFEKKYYELTKTIKAKSNSIKNNYSELEKMNPNLYSEGFADWVDIIEYQLVKHSQNDDLKLALIGIVLVGMSKH